MILLNDETRQKYEQDRNSLRLYEQENPRDRLNIELGDIFDEQKIQPQIKLLRFDNEFNFSVRAKFNNLVNPTIQADGNVLRWKDGQNEIRFYQKDKSEILPNGGFEMEQIVNLQKSGNFFYYTLETKNVSFKPQLNLTEKEKNDGHNRPDHMIGAYVIYSTKEFINIEGQNLYRCGKIGEIHAPIIKDSYGNFAKCDMVISQERGLIRIAVPDSFAAKAKNPCILDPTFGYTTQGSSFVSIDQDLLGSKFSGVAGRITSMSVCGTSGNTRPYKTLVVSYADKTILQVSSAVTGNNGWLTTTMSGLEIVDGYYILGAISKYTGGTPYIYYDSGDANQGVDDTSNDYATPTNPIDAGSSNRKYSIYATYTPQAKFMMMM